MSVCKTPYYQTAWFWILIIGIILLIAGLIVYAVYLIFSWTVIALLVIGILLIFIGGIWGAVRGSSCKKIVTMKPMAPIGSPGRVPITVTIPKSVFTVDGTYTAPVGCQPLVEMKGSLQIPAPTV